MARMTEYLDISLRIRVIMSVPWFYRTGERVRIYQEGLVGREADDKGPSYEMLRKWSLGEKKPTEDSLIKMILILTTETRDPPELTLDLLKSTTPIRELYRVLGVTPEKTEEMLFTLWSQHEANLCKTFTFDSEKEADQFSAFHSPGLYEGRRSPVGRMSPCDRFAIAIFGKVPATTHKSNKKFFVPAILTIRSSTSDTLYSYRGAMGRLARGLEWSFFQEGQGMLDRIRIMTSDGDSRFPIPYKGVMITITEGPQYLPISYEVEILKHSELSSWAATSNFLTRMPTPTRRLANQVQQSSRRRQNSGRKVRGPDGRSNS